MNATLNGNFAYPSYILHVSPLGLTVKEVVIMNSGENIVVTAIHHNHLEGIVRTHKKAFEDYFLTNLGDEFLQRYYSAFLEDGQTIAIGAFAGEELVGFILCSKNKGPVMGNFFRKNLGFIISSLIKQLLLGNKVIRAGIFSRIKTGMKVIQSLLIPKKNDSEKNQKNPRLLSIGVLPQFQGKGISTKMMASLHEQLQEEQIQSVGLSVIKGNDRAIHFYKKMGWHIEKTEKQTVYFVKNF